MKIVKAITVKLKKHSGLPVPDLPVYSLGRIAHNATNSIWYINCKHLSDRDCLLDLIIWFSQLLCYQFEGSKENGSKSVKLERKGKLFTEQRQNDMLAIIFPYCYLVSAKSRLVRFVSNQFVLLIQFFLPGGRNNWHLPLFLSNLYVA